MPEPAACAGESRVQVHGAAVDDGSTLHDACPRTAHVRVGMLRVDAEATERRCGDAYGRLGIVCNTATTAVRCVAPNPMLEQLVCCPRRALGLVHGSPSRYYSSAQQEGHVAAVRSHLVDLVFDMPSPPKGLGART
jgi:hypothetical protein